MCDLYAYAIEQKNNCVDCLLQGEVTETVVLKDEILKLLFGIFFREMQSDFQQLYVLNDVKVDRN